jgi:DNA-binding transcriptional LysR family regulator
MDLLTSIRVFRQVVMRGSFTKAAEDLDMSTAMASKHVTNLEQHVQARLLMRTSRRLHLTEAGQMYFDESGHALDILQQAGANASSGAKQPKGTLKITAPGWMAIPGFARWLSEYHELYPEVMVHLSLENRRVDLVTEGYDLALRVSHDPSPSLIVKPIENINFFLVASPDYLAKYGTPTKPADLLNHKGVLPTYTNLSNVVMHMDKAETEFVLPPSVLTSDTLMNYQLAKVGMGLAYLPEPVLFEDLADGSLVRVLEEYQYEPVTLYAAYINRQYLSAKVRTFIDFLAEKIRERHVLYGKDS